MENKKGFTLVAAVFILLVMTLLAITTSTFVASDAVVAVKNYNSLDAFYIASSGMEYYMKQLDGDDNWSTPPAGKVKDFSGGTFIIETTNESRNRITFTSTGLVTVEGTTYSRVIRPTIQRTTGGLSDILSEYVVYWGGGGSGDGSTIDNNATIVGDIFINSDLTLGNNINITGDALSTGSIEVGSGTSVTGTIETGIEPPYPPPTLETTYYDGQIAVAATSSLESQIYDDTTFSNTTYVKGDVTFDLNANISVAGNAVIVATGKVTVKNNVIVGDNLTVIAGGIIDISNNAILGKSGVWYSSTAIIVGNNAEVSDVEVGEGTQFITPGDVTFGNNIEFYGFLYVGGDFIQTGNNFYFEGNMIIGGDINVDENTTLILNPDLVDPGDIEGLTGDESGPETFEITEWEEVY
ncbi:MAG: pilus assembly PilX N-terminal domain-containing protein [Candidatus Margulisiibacteriota bacterium]